MEKNKYPDLARELKKLRNMKVTVILFMTAGLDGGGEVGNWRTSRDHSKFNIVKIGQNTDKSLEDMRRPGVTQTLVKDCQLKLV